MSSTRYHDRFKIIIQDIEAAGQFTIHGVAPGSSLACEALFASIGVSHLGGFNLYQASAQKSTERLLGQLRNETVTDPKIICPSRPSIPDSEGHPARPINP